MTPLLGWHPDETWDWVTTSPLFGLTVTVAAYAVGRWLHRRTGSALLQPVLVAIVLVAVLIEVADVPYRDYLVGGDYIAF